MKKTTAVAALLVLALVSLSTTMTGCHSDPHDTHVRTDVTTAR